MSVPTAQVNELLCHHCSHFLGESSIPLTFLGMFKHPQDRTYVQPPRDTYRCKSCGWVNVFRPAANWRMIEIKQRVG